MQFLFSNHVLDTDRRELSSAGRVIPVEPQVFDLLVHLLENRDRVVSKDDLIDKIWGGRIVSESTLTSRINAARKAIGDSGVEQNLIRTVPRKGVRFVSAVVTQLRSAGAEAAAPAPANQVRPGLPLPDRPAIAVLPFANMSGDREQDYFSDGISEDIITALSKLRWLFVIARNSSFIYKGRSVQIGLIAQELGVRYVVEGSVRRSGERIRISVQLTDVSTGSHIWAERYDRELADVFALQDEITESIVAAIEPQLYVAENFRAQRKPPGSLDAWDLVVRGLSHFWRVTRQDNMVAQALLEKAIAIDPHYGQALGVLATSHIFGAHMGWSDMGSVVPVAERAGLAAVEADTEDAWAHHGLAYTYLFERRFDDAIAEFELALRLNPNFSFAQAFHGVALCYSGRWEEGDLAVRRALRLSPRDPSSTLYFGIAAYAQFIGRNYDEAIRLARESLRQRGDFVGGHRVLTAAAAMAGYDEVARTALQELRRTQPNVSLAWIESELPIKQQAEREHYLEGFRRAGLT
ncbi:winged helix-turn-helix domain-containing protein [Bradyrhizobium sp. Tv2a-2]|uniref:winged helix-turn-helix domain-containing protein n=1 Tax=Bradyrhizobium sp. Tv2a-2 TaxID=113395 RepID=UPI0004641057|nr:winged helix-turn-helix domain-containing protein [Bradyrhizobium sp. Tv2a-2]